MSLRERLINAGVSVLSEGIDSSKEMLANNIVSSFDDMGMANANPGEFSPEEITDKNNLVNTAAMSNDTDFEGKEETQTDSKEDELINLIIELRKKAREEKRYDLSDEIRDSLSKLSIKDVKMHTIKRGDTLIGIAKKYRVSVPSIREYNPNLSDKRLRLGRQIAIPVPDVISL